MILYSKYFERNDIVIEVAYLTDRRVRELPDIRVATERKVNRDSGTRRAGRWYVQSDVNRNRFGVR